MPSGVTPPPKQTHLTPCRTGTFGDAAGRLAESRLRVDLALAGQDDVGRREGGLETGQLHDHLDAWPDGERLEAVGDGEQAGRRAAGGTGAGHIANPRAGRCLENVGVARQGSVQVRTCSSSAPFCGPYTAAAPVSPSNGLVTSDATVSETSAQYR